jgi:hypothetical protein
VTERTQLIRNKHRRIAYFIARQSDGNAYNIQILRGREFRSPSAKAANKIEQPGELSVMTACNEREK